MFLCLRGVGAGGGGGCVLCVDVCVFLRVCVGFYVSVFVCVLFLIRGTCRQQDAHQSL